MADAHLPPAKPRDLANLLNAAAATVEDPACLTDEERRELVEDLRVEADRVLAAAEKGI